MVIDSHQHFWKYHPDRHTWISEEMKILKRDYLPAELEAIYRDNGVDGCVSVQADQSTAETDFLLQQAADNDFIKGVVGWVDLCSPRVGEDLERYAANDQVVGFRHVVHDEPDTQFILRKDFQNGLGQLAGLGLTYDLLIFPIHLEVSCQVVKQFSHQAFVVDHIAKPPIATGDIADWKKGIRALADFDNVWCKLSGMVTEARWNDWTYEQYVPYMDTVLEAFGTDRVMFGSDWPVCLLSAGYPQMKGIVDRYIEALSEHEKKAVMGANAIKFYNLDS